LVDTLFSFLPFSFLFFFLLLTRICECGHRRILYNQWKEEKEKKKLGAAAVVAAAAAAASTLSLVVVTIVFLVMVVVYCGYKPPYINAEKKENNKKRTVFLFFSLSSQLFTLLPVKKKANTDVAFLSLVVAPSLPMAAYNILVWTSDNLLISTSAEKEKKMHKQKRRTRENRQAAID
jgi:hypothetical protein